MAKTGEKEPNKQETSAKGRKSNRIQVVVNVVVCTAALAMLTAIIVLLNRNSEAAETGPTAPGYVRGTVITEDNVDEVLAQADEPVKAGSYNCTMNVEWHFEDSSKASYDAYVLNSALNTYTVYFDVNLEGTNELVYTSPYIPVKAELKEIQLMSRLAAGTYPAIVTYHLVDENFDELSTVAVSVTLFIEN